MSSGSMRAASEASPPAAPALQIPAAAAPTGPPGRHRPHDGKGPVFWRGCPNFAASPSPPAAAFPSANSRQDLPPIAAPGQSAWCRARLHRQSAARRRRLASHPATGAATSAGGRLLGQCLPGPQQWQKVPAAAVGPAARRPPYHSAGTGRPGAPSLKQPPAARAARRSPPIVHSS